MTAKIHLGKPAPFAAVLIDGEGKPVVGAKVRVEWIADSSEQTYYTSAQRSSARRIEHIRLRGRREQHRRESIRHDDRRGRRVRLPGIRRGLGAEARGDHCRRPCAARPVQIGRGRSAPSGPGGPGVRDRRARRDGPARGGPRRQGRRPGRDEAAGCERVRADGLLPAKPPARSVRTFNQLEAEVQTDADGRFTFDGLDEGTINVVVHGDGENKDWTYRAAKDVNLTLGATSEVTLELIRGVEIAGTVVAQGTGAPVEGAQVGVYGPFRPRTSAMTLRAMTDARGRYRYRLPSGETYFYVMGPPHGFTRLSGEGSSRTVTIPDEAPSYEVPPIEVAAAVTVLRGRVLNATGTPIAGAMVVGISEGGFWRPLGVGRTPTDAHGEFRLPPELYTVAVGKPARLLFRLRGGAEYETAAVPTKDGAVTVKLPVAGEDFKGIDGPRDVAPDELAGVVVDVGGKPIEGAEVDAWTWFPGNEAKTDGKGFFRIGKLDKDRKVEVLVRKPGYTPQLFQMQPTGKPGWVVVLGNKTYFEGRVTGPDGKPVAGALISADYGPKWADGVMITEISTEATTDDDGRYRMYAQPDLYDILVRAPGVGLARLPDTWLGADEAKRLDVRLNRWVTFGRR